jgi:hypothetical protein
MFMIAKMIGSSSFGGRGDFSPQASIPEKLRNFGKQPLA